MRPQKICESFRQLCRAQAEQMQPLDAFFEEEKKASAFTMVFRAVKLQLVYRMKGGMAAPPSVLYCRVFLNKNSPVYMHLPELLPLMDAADYRACYFPYIENTERMTACFRRLTGMLEEYLPRFEALAMAGEDRELMLRWVRDYGIKDAEPEKLLRLGSEEQDTFLFLLQLQETGLILRYSAMDAYESFLRGDRAEALRRYDKLEKNGLTLYEMGLREFLRQEESADFSPMPAECFALGAMKQVSGGKKDLALGLKCFLLMFAICGAAGCLLMGIYQLLSSWGTVCWFGCPWYWGLLVGALPAMFGAIAFRRWLMRLVGGRNVRAQLDFDDIVNGSVGAERFYKATFAAATVFGLVMGLLMGGASVRLYDDYGDYLAEGALFRRERFEYRDVTAIYYIHARYNDWDERIDRASYVIAMGDGRLLDLDGSTSVTRTEQEALPLFEQLGIKVIELDSDRDLP